MNLWFFSIISTKMGVWKISSSPIWNQFERFGVTLPHKFITLIIQLSCQLIIVTFDWSITPNWLNCVLIPNDHNLLDKLDQKHISTSNTHLLPANLLNSCILAAFNRDHYERYNYQWFFLSLEIMLVRTVLCQVHYVFFDFTATFSFLYL